jgi:hypothetical protein
MTLFYDSTRPALIPANSNVCLYGDGEFSAIDYDISRFAAVRWITVLGSVGCGIADYEPGNLVYTSPGALRVWAQGRKIGGHRARIYCDRDHLAQAQNEVFGLENVLWWIATLDGDRLTADYNGLPMWGVQYAGGPAANYDTSILYGVW